MTATTASMTNITAATPQWQRVARFMLRYHGIVLFWSLLAVTGTGAAAAIVAFASDTIEPTMSALQFGIQIAVWAPFVVNIIMIASYLRPMLAAGATRRSIARSGLVTSASFSAVYALLTTGLLLIERAVYRSQGWVHAYGDGSGELLFSDGVASQLWGTAAFVAATALSGLLCGVAYFHFRAWATLLLPLTVFLPVGAIAALVKTPRMYWLSSDSAAAEFFSRLDGAPAFGVQLLVIALTATAVWLVLRNVPSRQATN